MIRVDAPGLVSAAQRLASAVGALGAGAGVPHPPLGADPASLGAAQRLSLASTELAAGLTAHVSALVASLEHLAGVTVTFTETDQQNADALATLRTAAGPAPVSGSAPPPPPLPADLRSAFPSPAGMTPETLSAAAHAGTVTAGESFTAAWSSASSAAHDAAEQLRSSAAGLPDVLDGPASTPAAARHLLAFADGLDGYAERGHALATQASGYAANLAQARHDIPTPAQHTEARNRIVALAQANAASGGRYAVPLADAVNAKTQLNERTVAAYTGYHQNTDITTAATEPGGGDPAADSLDPASGTPEAAGAADPATPGSAMADPAADPLTAATAGNSGELASMLPQMIPAVLGAAGGLVGGLLGSVTSMPEALMQAGSQAISAAAQSLSGVAQSKMDPMTMSPAALGEDLGGIGGDAGAGGVGDMGGGDLGGAGGHTPTSPAGGDGVPSLAVAPTTGAPPTPAITPVGAAGAPSAPASAGPAGMPMGTPMGGMGGMGAGGGRGGGDKESGPPRKVVARDRPHTEDITGRTDTNRLEAASAAHRERTAAAADGDGNPPPPDLSTPVVRRVTTRPPKEPT